MLTVTTSIYTTLDTVRDAWTQPQHITQRNHASPDRHCPTAHNDLQVDGKFSYTMAAKDGSFSFDFGGTYTHIEDKKSIEYVMDDGRKCTVFFVDENCGTIKISETFDPETENSLELQQQGRQAILDNFKKYVENL
jgi:uncharacterized protein YndB with AHSA1/START domain